MDAVTAGRVAFGERWAAERVQTRIRLHRGGGLLLDDGLLLDPAHGDVGRRLGPYDALATLVLLGPQLDAGPEPAWSRTDAVETRAPLEGGCLVRLAATSTAALAAAVRSPSPPCRQCSAMIPGADGGEEERSGVMHLTPRELDKLMLHQAGFLAQKRLARGLRLNYPEAVALIATQILELIRDGRSRRRADGSRAARCSAARSDGRRAEMVAEVQVEGTFPDGTKLVTVHHPIVAEHGDLALALYGSFLPVPRPRAASRVPPRRGADAARRGARRSRATIVLNEGRATLELA